MTAELSRDTLPRISRESPGVPSLRERYEMKRDITIKKVNTLLLPMRGREDVAAALRERRLERAIGVIYRPETERVSHYFRARLSDQFDAVIHIDDTRAVEPLERTAGWETGDAPETYPVAV